MKPSKNAVVLALTREAAFDVICDPALYPRWLVGAHAIRDIDASWPALGSRFKHRVGVGVLAVPGSTTVRALDAPHVLELAAGMGVLGESKVRFELTSVGGGTEVRMVEAPTKGVAALASRVVSPVVRMSLWGRNQASLEELAEIARELADDSRGQGHVATNEGAPARVADAAVAAGGRVVGADATGARSVEGPNSF